MGLFDFLKKKEFEKITLLESQNTSASIQIDNLTKRLKRYGRLVSIEDEADRIRKELESVIHDKNLEINGQESELNLLKANYKSSLDIYKRLQKEVSIFENKLDLIEYGVYAPVYDFEKSDEYRFAQTEIIDEQKDSIRYDNAAVCTTNWTMEGSEAKGKAVVKVYKKLMLRAFNGECDVMIAKVKWNNVDQMKVRMDKVFEAINKLGEGFRVSLSWDYLKLKKQELILEYEFQRKKQEEKEKMRAIQEELREEEKARRDFEKAQREAEKQEAVYQKALDKVRREFEQSNGVNAEFLKDQIARLEQELLDVQAKKERALSMAQQTKRGHVYVISNIGSFGEDVYKIGMTRRLEPIDRVRELGDASVPFKFDVHAMIYSDEARTLEYELHKAFSHKKVNMLNYRREFFKVSLDEIEETISRLGFKAEFTRLPEAMEYTETLSILSKLKNKEDVKTIDELILEEFPAFLEFDDE